MARNSDEWDDKMPMNMTIAMLITMHSMTQCNVVLFTTNMTITVITTNILLQIE